MLSRGVVSKVISTAKYRTLSLSELLKEASYGYLHGITGWQAERFYDLWLFMDNLHEKLLLPSMKAGDLLAWMVEWLGYLDYFKDYYGDGEHSDEKRHAVVNFIRYVTLINLKPAEIFSHLDNLDTTQGKPENELIVFTTIYRTKGLEFDFVVVPQCDENILPYIRNQRTDIFDTQGLVKEIALSNVMESERRLFYVAVTRARKGVLIGTSQVPSRFIQEALLQETESIMSTVQMLASGDARAKDQLLNLLQSSYLPPGLLKNLVVGYLPDMHEGALADEIEKITTELSTEKDSLEYLPY
jgi:DNA helicase II / ATP-dependent DNA helicase PcrA